MTFIVLEFGTYSFDRGLVALRADYWLHGRGAVDWNAAETRRVKVGMRKHFFPDTEIGRCCFEAARFSAKRKPAWRKSAKAFSATVRPTVRAVR